MVTQQTLFQTVSLELDPLTEGQAHRPASSTPKTRSKNTCQIIKRPGQDEPLRALRSASGQRSGNSSLSGGLGS